MGDGFITWQGRKDYRASYGDHNKTQKSFKTMREAKAYLKSKGITHSIYDSGYRTTVVKNIVNKKKVVRRQTNTFGIPRNMFRF